MKKDKNKVRLNKNYLDTIKSLARKHFNSYDVKIFGSRTDLNEKGGDIDIFIKTGIKSGILDAKIAFLRDFEKILGEQKVDLVVSSTKSRKKRIDEIADAKGVKI